MVEPTLETTTDTLARIVPLCNARKPGKTNRGITLDDEDPALGILLGVQSELSLIASLVERTQPGADFDLTEIAPVLESMGRRLDVALELMARAKRAQTPGAPLTRESTPALDGTCGRTGGST